MKKRANRDAVWRGRAGLRARVCTISKRSQKSSVGITAARGENGPRKTEKRETKERKRGCSVVNEPGDTARDGAIRAAGDRGGRHGDEIEGDNNEWEKIG